MYDIKSSVVICYGLNGVLEIALPIILLYYGFRWKNWRIYPVIIGIVAMTLCGMVRALLRSVLISDSYGFIERVIASALIGAVCEEGARYLAMRFAMPNNDRLTDAFSYAVGHGGAEMVLTQAYIYPMRLFIVGHRYLNGITVTDSERLRILSESSIFDVIMSGLHNSVEAALLNLCCSALILLAIRFNSRKQYIVLAIAAHALLNIITVIFGDIFAFIATIGFCILSYKLCDNYAKENYI